MRVLGLCVLVGVVFAAPTQLTADNAAQSVGLSLFEAKMMALSKLGLYELKFTQNDIKEMIVAANPFEKYRESDENVVLMDEFPYVPIVDVPSHNATVVLSNLVLEEKMNPELVKVNFVKDYQSFTIVDIAVNATFEWRINQTNIGGRAKVIIPQAWVHQNIEIACSHEQPSILVWEGRIDFYPTDFDITTSVADKSFVDSFAAQLHSSDKMRKYIANAMQHQLAANIGKLHWKLQERMRDDCLQCHGMRYSSEVLEVLIKGDAKCLGNLPSFILAGVIDEKTAKPQDVLEIAPAALKQGLSMLHPKPTQDELLQGQDLESISATKAEPPTQLRPRFDWREKFRHHTREGFIEDTAQANPMMAKIGKMWMDWRGTGPKQPQNGTAAVAAQGGNGSFGTTASPANADGHVGLKRYIP